jgi:hypothetical protein
MLHMIKNTNFFFISIFGIIANIFIFSCNNNKIENNLELYFTHPNDKPEIIFQHPGILVGVKQLEFVKKMILEGKEPWISAFNRAKNDAFGSLDYKPKPWTKVECGSYSNPNYGCSDESNDSSAAYTQALLWYYTGNENYAKKSIEIMNAWSNTLKSGHTNSNAPLQASWVAEKWPRAAEIIRYSYSGWDKKDMKQFEVMLKKQYLPNIEAMGSCYVTNWKASGIEGRLNIAIFLEDKILYNKAIDMWRKLVPSAIYLKADGLLPIQPPGCSKDEAKLIKYWFGQTTFVDGMSQEICRDLEHTAYGLSAIINIAETTHIQGLDLYGEQAERITKAMEFHTIYQNGNMIPAWLCKGNLQKNTNGTFEIGYNHFVNRLGYNLPETEKWLLAPGRRPTKGYFPFLWETLTHADTGITLTK